MYTFYFEVINTLWGAKFKLYATDSPLELGREFQRHEIETLVKAGARVMLEPSKFVMREEPVLRVAKGYFEPKPITLQSVGKFVDNVMSAVSDPEVWAVQGQPEPTMTASDMLRNVVGSLKAYPYGGGDTEVMNEVDRIVKDTMLEVPLPKKSS